MRQIMPISCSRSSPASVRSLSFHRPASIAIRQAALDEARKSGFPDFPSPLKYAAEDALLERRPTSAFAAKTT
jgi:hypothetical protein